MMMRLLLATSLLLGSCSYFQVDDAEVSTSISIMIIGSVVPDASCVMSVNSTRLKRGILDIKTVTEGNPVGLEYNTGLIIRDQTETGVGSKRLEVTYDFSSNLIQPSTPTRNSLRREITVPFGGWTEESQGSTELIAAAPVIPEHVVDLLANDPNIATALHRGSDTMNTVAGLPGYYTVQLKLEALSRGKNGQWLRSPPYYMTIDLCDGCLTRNPAQLVPAEPLATCRRNQDEMWQVLEYPPFPDLSATTEGPEEPNEPAMEIEVSNGGNRNTLGSLGAKAAGASKAGVWLASPRHIGAEQFPFRGLSVPSRSPFGACEVGAIEEGESEKCGVPSYPGVCDNAERGCRTSEDCGGGSCNFNPVLLVPDGEGDERIIRHFHCGSPTEGGDGDADAGPAGADAGLPVVACLYIVCADIDNEVFEWSVETESWESVASNCSCYSEDSELADSACPF